MDQRLAIVAAGISSRGRKLRQDALGNELGIATNTDGDRLGQADAVGIDIDLNDLGGLRPVVDAVTRQGRERIEPCAQRQNHIGLGDQLHRCLRAIVAERADRKPVAARETVIVLVVVANRRIELFGERNTFGNCVAEHDARTRQNDREFRARQQLRRLRHGLGAAGRPLELDDRRQTDIDDLRPVVTRNIDLRGRRQGAWLW